MNAAQLAQILDLFGEDSWRRVYAGELEVRPPGAPTTEADFGIRLSAQLLVDASPARTACRNGQVGLLPVRH